MSLDLVQRALLKGIADVLGTLPTQYENQLFDPPKNAKWAAVHFIPNPIEVDTLGRQGSDWVDGLVQIDFNYPLNTGSGEGRADFERVRAAFPAGTRLEHGGQSVRVKNVSRIAGRQVNGNHRVSVTLEWYAMIPR